MTNAMRPALTLFFLFTILTGAIYPAAVLLVSRVAFSEKSQGSLIIKDGVVLGSRLIGQNFGDPKYFWGRPSATSPYAYNAVASAASNLSPANPALRDKVKSQLEKFHNADSQNRDPVPVDLVTTSGSGLDPHISFAAAEYQIARIAKARKMEPDKIREIVLRHTEAPTFGFLGESRVNVLTLNLELDGKLPSEGS